MKGRLGIAIVGSAGQNTDHKSVQELKNGLDMSGYSIEVKR